MFDTKKYEQELKQLYKIYTQEKCPPAQKVFVRIDDLLKRIHRKKILDASGGSLAKTTIFLAEKGYDVYYSEVDKEFVKYASYALKHINAKYAKPKNRCVVSYCHELPKEYGEGFFDGIVCIMVLSRGDWNVIKRDWKGISSVLKKGGYIQLVLHKHDQKNTLLTLGSSAIPQSIDAKHPHNKYSYDFAKIKHEWRNEIMHMYPKEEIVELCKENGLKIVKLETMKMFWKQSPYWYLLAQKSSHSGRR